MARNDEARRLFDPDRDLLSEEEIAADREQALSVVGTRHGLDLDSARMWTSRDDGRLVRGVKHHSAEKSAMVSRAIGTVSSAMSGKWFAREHGLAYLELYSGPGRLLDEATGHEQLGSPLQALDVPKPFTFYVFNDYSRECVAALRERVGERTDVRMECGDANDPAHLEFLATLLNPKALLIAYLDPARPQDLAWSTVRFLAERFGFIDLIINLPVNSLMRAIAGAYGTGYRESGTSGRFLNHPHPHELLRRGRNGRLIVSTTIAAIREHYDVQLQSLGFKQPARRTVDFPPGNPYYDILLASRHQMALELWNRTNPVPIDPQLSMLDFLDDDV
jgi:three-Cys-motif partner protein